jgi:hypothetical protein
MCERDFGEVDRMLIHKALMHDPRLLAPHAVVNILDILRSESMAEIDIVKAELEIIDKRGHEYQVSINRTSKGLILTKERAKDLVEILEWQMDTIRDILPDAKDDGTDWFDTLNRLYFSSEFIVQKVRKEADIPKKQAVEENGKET